MTLLASRYDIDERLTLEQPKAFRGPLQPDSTKMEQNGSAPSTPQRSIFADYWKTGPRPDSPLSRFPASPKHVMEEVKPLSLTRRRIIHNTYTYNFDKNANPFRFFGIEEDEGRLTSTDLSTDDDENDCDSLNSYERHLQKSEVGVASEVKHPRRSLTSPSLSRSMATMTLEGSRRKTQSDTALFVKAKKKPSCLRKSRFSFDSDSIESDSNRGVSYNMGATNGERRPSVSFEPMIKVHEFQEPVERWASNGWSNWFGTWQ